jgi:hypothetical protein
LVSRKGEAVISFKLKSGLKFMPEDKKYIVVDEALHSTYRIGQYEYLILKQLAEATNLEEVSYRLHTEQNLNISYDKLNQFIQRAIKLNIIDVVDDSPWSNLKSSGVFAFKMRLFDPNPILDGFILIWRRFKYFWMTLASLLFLTTISINIIYFQSLWGLKSWQMPPYALFIFLCMYVLSLGHELLHGVAAKCYGFDVPEVGFRLHFFLPSFYCKILKTLDADRKSVATVFLVGSIFDLLIISLLVLIWFLGSTGETVKEIIAYTVSLFWIKILLLQLNPLFPFSDGNRILGLFILRKRGQ